MEIEWEKVAQEIKLCKLDAEVISDKLPNMTDKEKKEAVYFFAERLLRYSNIISGLSENIIVPSEEE